MVLLVGLSNVFEPHDEEEGLFAVKVVIGLGELGGDDGAGFRGRLNLEGPVGGATAEKECDEEGTEREDRRFGVGHGR